MTPDCPGESRCCCRCFLPAVVSGWPVGTELNTSHPGLLLWLPGRALGCLILHCCPFPVDRARSASRGQRKRGYPRRTHPLPWAGWEGCNITWLSAWLIIWNLVAASLHPTQTCPSFNSFNFVALRFFFKVLHGLGLKCAIYWRKMNVAQCWKRKICSLTSSLIIHFCGYLCMSWERWSLITYMV